MTCDEDRWWESSRLSSNWRSYQSQFVKVFFNLFQSSLKSVVPNSEWEMTLFSFQFIRLCSHCAMLHVEDNKRNFWAFPADSGEWKITKCELIQLFPYFVTFELKTGEFVVENIEMNFIIKFPPFNYDFIYVSSWLFFINFLALYGNCDGVK